METCSISGKKCTELKTFYVSESIDTQYKNLSLCYKCARSHFAEEKMAIQQPKTCNECGATIETIAENGKLGCLHCLVIFGPQIVQAFNPTATKSKTFIKYIKEIDSHILALTEKLNDSIKKERYEDAANFRDEILKASKILEQQKELEVELDKAVINSDQKKSEELKMTLDALKMSFKSPGPPEVLSNTDHIDQQGNAI